MDDPSIQAINTRISNESSVVDGQVSLSVDLGTKNAWENSLVTQLNDHRAGEFIDNLGQVSALPVFRVILPDILVEGAVPVFQLR